MCVCVCAGVLVCVLSIMFSILPTCNSFHGSIFSANSLMTLSPCVLSYVWRFVAKIFFFFFFFFFFFQNLSNAIILA